METITANLEHEATIDASIFYIGKIKSFQICHFFNLFKAISSVDRK